MKRRKLLSFGLISALLLFACFLLQCRNSAEQEVMENISLVATFPDNESEVLLSDPVNLAFSDDAIFISDWRQSTIFVFNKEGNYQHKIGQEGKGPEEFTNQTYTKFNSNKLFVLDQGNRRIAIIDLAADTNRVYSKRDLFREFAVSNDKIFAFIPSFEYATSDSTKLIKMFDHSLNEIGTFGHYLNHVDNMNQWASFPNLEMHDGNLYASFSSFPILRIYSTNGELLKTLELNNPNENYKDRIERNYNPRTYDERGEKSRKLFESFAVNREGFFFNVYDKNALIIDHFSLEGNFVKRYEKEISSEDFFVRDIEVILKENKGLRFYILNITDGIPKVDIYEAETNNQQTASLPRRKPRFQQF